METREPQCTVGGNADWWGHCGKQYGISSKKLKMELPVDPAIPLLKVYCKNPETPIQKNLCTPMFIAAEFTIAKCLEQPKCPSLSRWVDQKPVVHLHNGILHRRRNEVTPTLCDSMDGTGERYAKWCLHFLII